MKNFFNLVIQRNCQTRDSAEKGENKYIRSDHFTSSSIGFQVKYQVIEKHFTMFRMDLVLS